MRLVLFLVLFVNLLGALAAMAKSWSVSAEAGFFERVGMSLDAASVELSLVGLAVVLLFSKKK